jgi:hypothetical protein
MLKNRFENGIIYLILFFFLIGGCSSKFTEIKEMAPIQTKVDKELEKNFGNKPSIVRVPIKRTELNITNGLEDPFLKKEIDAEFVKKTLPEMARSLSKIYDLNIIVPSEVKEKHIEYSINFKGKLGNFLNNLSEVTGYFITYEDGLLRVEKTKRFNLYIPNVPQFASSSGGAFG